MSKPSQWKAKGREFQQKIRNLFCNVGGLVPEVDVASRQMGGTGEDVVFLTEKAKALFGEFYVECKAEKSGFNPHKFMESHPVNDSDRRLLLFHKRDRGPTLVTMSGDTFTHLLESKVWVDSNVGPEAVITLGDNPPA